jgi:PAS domain S-box-containing protein
MRVLLLEDPTVQVSACAALEALPFEEGVDLARAASFPQAVEAVRKASPDASGGFDVMVLCAPTPGRPASSGKEEGEGGPVEIAAALSRLRAEVPELPVVIIAEEYDPATAREWIESGAQDVLLQEELASSRAHRALRSAAVRHRQVLDAREVERRHRELQRSEAGLRTIFEGAAAGISVTRLDGTYEYANPAYLEMLGYSMEELRALHFEAVTHPADRARNRELYEDLLAGRRSSFVLEKRNVRKDGRSVWLRVSASVLRGEGGTPTHAVAVAENVTQRRLAEQRARTSERLVAIAGTVARLGGWSVDLAGDTVYWSDQVCDIHEMPRGTRVPVDQGISFYAPESRPVIAEAFRRCISEGTPWDLDLEIITAKGNRTWVRTIGEPTRNARGDIDGVHGAFHDISRQKATESELRRLEEEARILAERLSRTLDSVTDAFYVLDSDWRITYANPMGEALAQRSRSELLGMVLWEAFPDVVGTPIHENYEAAVASGEPRLFIYRYPAYDLWVDVRAYPSSEGLAVYMRDVTAEQRAAQRIKEMQERFRLAARSASDVLFDWDVAAGTVWWGDGLREAFGIEPEAMDGRVTGWMERVHPEDRDAVHGGIEAAILSDTEEWQAHYRLIRDDGATAWVEARGAILRDAEGRALRMVGGVSDVTERMAVTERLREQADLLDRARDAILVRDLDHSIRYANRGAERLYGWTREEMVGKSERELLPVETQAFDGALGELLEHGEWTGELEHRRRDGSRITVECRWSLERGRDGAPRRVLSIGTDVSERKRLLAQFLRAQRLESIGTLAGGIAHDLNNVLAPILLSIGLLQEDIEDPQIRETLDTIGQSAERGASMVRQVLAFARGMEAGELALDLEEAVDELIRVIRDSFPKSIALETTFPEGLWHPRGEPTQIHQVLMNLAVNARDAMPEGGVLRISASNVVLGAEASLRPPEVEPGRYVCLTVADNGTGMAPEVVAQIFDPFFTTKEVGQGTGLGLSTVTAIVQGHGGFLQVDSHPGTGSSFSVYLPAVESMEGARGVSDAPGRAPRGSGELILVVDDEPSVRRVAQRTLEAFGYRIITAADGADALAVYEAAEEPVALVLTDITMPVMDGLSAVRALRELDPQLPVIVTSGLETDGGTTRATEAGGRIFLPKPYTAETLLQAVAEALQKAHS